MTTMIKGPETDTTPRLEELERSNRGLRTAVTVLVIITVAMAGWILFDFLTEADTAPTSAVTQTVDDYTTAWNNYDGDAFMALTTPGYMFSSAGGQTFRQADQADVIETSLPARAWSVEEMGDPIMTGDDPYYVSWPIKVTTNVREYEGVSILTLVSDGDGFAVARHVVIGDF